MKLELASGLPSIRANPAQLRLMVTNLVTNAVDAVGDRYGVIRLRTQSTTSALGANESTNETQVVLEVSNSGSGIAASNQPGIFDPFFTTTRSGRGLGLAVAHAIVQGLGGTIESESEPGGGSTLRVVFPGQSGIQTAESRDLPLLTNDKTTVPETILVVEDEASIRVAAAKAFRRSNLSVLEAADGTTALDCVREHYGTIRAILLDVALPGATSREVFAEARRLNNDVKIVVTSAYSERDARASFSGMRIDAFLAKPYRLSELVDVLRSVLGTRSIC